METMLKRYLILALGWIFIALGILGIFLPFLQGFLFLFVGLYLLSQESLWAKKILNRLKKRYPHLYQKFYMLKDQNKKRLKRLFRR